MIWNLDASKCWIDLCGWFANGPNFEWNLEARPFEIGTKIEPFEILSSKSPDCAIFFGYQIPTVKHFFGRNKEVVSWGLDFPWDYTWGHFSTHCFQISVADILACCELEQPQMAGYNVREGRPILADYMERVKKELNPHYEEAHKIVYQV